MSDPIVISDEGFQKLTDVIDKPAKATPALRDLVSLNHPVNRKRLSPDEESLEELASEEFTLNNPMLYKLEEKVDSDGDESSDDPDKVAIHDILLADNPD